MKVHFKQITEEGLCLEGEEADDVLGLGTEESARQAGPVRYALDIGRDDKSIWATGQVEVELDLECVRCLERFVFPLTIPDVALQIPIEGPAAIDLTPYVREDILLALPAYPRCDWAGDKVCVAAVLQSAPPSPSASVDSPEPQGPTSPIWRDLDRLKLDDPT